MQILPGNVSQNGLLVSSSDIQEIQRAPLAFVFNNNPSPNYTIQKDMDASAGILGTDVSLAAGFFFSFLPPPPPESP